MRFHINHKRIKKEIDPDEIFLDSKNLPEFNTQQFEGRLEKSISKRTIFYLGLFFACVGVVFIWKTINLQIIKGEIYFQRSENNTLNKKPIFADRGLIYDRQGVPLAWNSWKENSFDKFSSPQRSYIKDPGFSLLLGYVSQPTKDSSGKYWQEYFVGKDGIEKFYDKDLTGENGVLITEIDVKGNVQSENVILPPISGQNINLAIDSRIQKRAHEAISTMARNSAFVGGVGIIMDIKTGEILTLTNYPEYDSNVLSTGKDEETIDGYMVNKGKVFLNRAISGLYAPGSIVKPFIGYAALVEEVISPLKNILSSGSISIPNPYYPELKSVFKDHGSFGYVDMRRAIAVSSDVYFYEIGGGYEDQKGIGIMNIDKYMRMFGVSEKTGIDLIGEKTGTIPTPEWKAKTYNGDPWRVGDTYNSSIGQYGFHVTPIQMVKAIAGIGNMGIIPTPSLRLSGKQNKSSQTSISIDLEKMKVIHEGMRMAVTEGTATALYLPNVKVAAKTGTAQVGLGNTNTNSWILGFFPYDNPKYSFVFLMDRGPKEASGNATWVAKEVIDYISVYTPEYLE